MKTALLGAIAVILILVAIIGIGSQDYQKLNLKLGESKAELAVAQSNYDNLLNSILVCDENDVLFEDAIDNLMKIITDNNGVIIADTDISASYTDSNDQHLEISVHLKRGDNINELVNGY